MPDIQRVTTRNRQEWLALRQQDVTASAVGALFHEHEFLSAFELWARKTGRLQTFEEETPAMQRGRLLEPVAVQLIRERYPDWRVEHNAAENVYYRDPEARIGGTPDVIVESPEHGRGVIQIKSVEASVYRRKWIVDGETEPPFWIALQATVEAYLTGARWAAVAPLVVGHGLDMPLVEIPLTPGVMDAVKERAAAFWRLVESGQEPTPDFARDAHVIDRLYAQGDPKEEIDLSTDNRIYALIEDRHRAAAQKKDAETALKEIDAEVKAKMGTAEIARLGDGRVIKWQTRNRKGYVVEPTTYRAMTYPAPA